MPSEGAGDRGDLTNIPWVLEAKNTKAMDMAAALKEAEKEAKNAGKRLFMAVFKRRNHSVADAYAVMPLWMAAELMARDGS